MHTLDDLHSGALHGARHVQLTGLGLTEFPEELLALADTLEILDLSHNQLQSLPDSFAHLHRLRTVFASHNPFTQLPRVLGRCPQLEMVGFKACAIDDVPADSLPQRLRWLILTDNRIAQLPATLGERPRLQKLMLACNRLRTLPELHEGSALELLRLASNHFTQVPATVLALPALAWPALAGNPLTLAHEHATLTQATAHSWHWDDLAVHELLGSGASGHIYRATSAAHPAGVALKVFKAAHTSDGTPQSELAAGLAAGQHPYLLTPLARVHGLPNGQLATALPLLDASWHPLAGPPSFASCTRDVYDPTLRLTAAQAQRLLACVRAAVEHLHAHGVLHGDLYAHNILWQPSTGHAMLSDLGAALLTGQLATAEAQRLQAMEWRAFAHLEAEIQARTLA